jgi:uncharacterized protein
VIWITAIPMRGVLAFGSRLGSIATGLVFLVRCASAVPTAPYRRHGPEDNMTQMLLRGCESPVALVRRALAALRAGDLDAMLEDCAVDIGLEHVGDPLHLPYAGRYFGHAGVAEYLRRIDTAAEILAYEPVEIAAVGQDRVMVLGREHMRFRMTGLDSMSRWVHLFTLAGGCIAAVTLWSDGAAQLVGYRGY